MHVSKVRSLTLDAWEHAQLKVMAELGNVAVNGVYEADAAAAAAATAARATPKCSRSVRRPPSYSPVGDVTGLFLRPVSRCDVDNKQSDVLSLVCVV